MEERLSLANLGKGAAVERFDDELQKVLENILDPNTRPDLVRSVTLTVKIKPNEDRDFANVEIQATSKLAPYDHVPTHIYIGTEKGRAVAVEPTKNIPVDDTGELTVLRGGER